MEVMIPAVIEKEIPAEVVREVPVYVELLRRYPM